MNLKEKEKQILRFKILTANNEQRPFKYPNTKFYQMPISHGDYTIEYDGKSYLDKISVERKGNISELYIATGSERKRWKKELENLSKKNIAIILCEFSFMDIVNKQPYGKLLASSVYGSICSWNAKYGISFIFCENRNNARAYMYKLFYKYVEYKILNF